MRILLVSPHFYPEDFKCNDVAFDLARRGHEVTVLSDIPNYPIGRFFDGYGIFKKRVEVLNGVKIIRVLVVPRGDGRAIRLLLNYFSFAFFASIRAFFLALFCRFDAILVHETSPITVGIPALLVKKIQKIPFYFWVLDLWPESLAAAGGVRNKYVLNFFAAIAKSMYRNSTKILVSSKGFSASILQKGDFKDKIEYFPNWAEDLFATKKQINLPTLPSGFLVMFAGNIGEAQDIDHVMKAALSLKEEKDIKFIFVGDGRKKIWLDDFIRSNQLEETVYALGRYPIDAMPAFFATADVMLLSLKNDYIFSLTAPAKLQAYMAAGKPVVAMIDGESRNLIAESSCGISGAACDYETLAQNIKTMRNMPTEELKALGKNGQMYYKRNFTKEICMEHLCDILKIIE